MIRNEISTDARWTRYTKKIKNKQTTTKVWYSSAAVRENIISVTCANGAVGPDGLRKQSR